MARGGTVRTLAYIQVEASVRTHKKFLEAGPAASWLWLCGMGYCQDGLTDGFIPCQAIEYLGVKASAAKKLTCVLVVAGLWEVVEGGWRVHDYLDHNRSASDIQTTKDRRKAGGSLGGRPTKESAEKPPRLTTEVVSEVNHAENPSHLISSHRQIISATTARGASIHTTHRSHAVCGRICLPAFLHAEFVGRRNHPGADQELRTWYLVTLTAWTDGPHAKDEPGEPIDFWRARYDEQWPTVATKPAGKWANWKPREAARS